MGRQFGIFLVRWLCNSFGIWLAVRIFGSGYSETQLHDGLWVIFLAGLIFSIVNAVLKPVIVVLSLPAILLTLGLFTVFINGVMVYLSLALAPGISMEFWHSILAGIILSLLNYIVSATFELRAADRNKENA